MPTRLNNPEMSRNVMEQAAEAIIVVDNDNRVLYQNPEARQIFGYDDEELVGQTVHDSLHHHYVNGEPVPLEQCQVYRAAVYGEKARDFIWMMNRKNGEKIYVSGSSAPLYIAGAHVGAIFFANDITQRKQTEDAWQKASQQLQLAAEIGGIGLFDYYHDSGELVWSDTLKKQFGLPPDAPATLDTFFARLHPDDRERVKQHTEELARPESGGTFQHEYRVIGQEDGKERWIASKGRVFYENGKAVRQMGATIEITDRKLIEENLRHAAHHDPLTGLPNRAMLAEYAEHLLAMAERDGADSAVLFVDLDRFKPINDEHGHDAGDIVLQEVAKRLRLSVRKEDIVSRMGGDEFIVLLPHVDNPSDPQTVADHILEKISKPIPFGDVQLNVSPSIGISLYPKHGKDIESLIRCADMAMYAAKKGGRNNYKVYIPGQDEKTHSQLQLEMHLKQALDANAMTLLYQPIVDIDTGEVVGVEALLRMVGETGNLVTPDQLIPVAESAGLIDKLGQWVVHEACKQHQIWRDSGLPPFSIAINVSALEFGQRSFASHLGRTIRESGIDPSCLQIELTERAVMDNVSDSIATLREIRAMGVRISLDDFGTGYSSLSYLSNLPLDKLKIDQSFIRSLDSKPASQTITDTIIAMGRSLNLEIVGEGIESESAMEYLRQHGCDQAQGYFLSKPLPANEFESWYRSKTSGWH